MPHAQRLHSLSSYILLSVGPFKLVDGETRAGISMGGLKSRCGGAERDRTGRPRDERRDQLFSAQTHAHPCVRSANTIYTNPTEIIVNALYLELISNKMTRMDIKSWCL